jgi:Fic family protein
MKPFRPNLLPPPDLDWGSLVTWIGDAQSALARYDGILQGLVNPQILLSPLAKREAVLSSRIEGTQASLNEVLRFEADPVEEKTEKYADIQEIINYDRAMMSAVDELKAKPLTLNLIRKMHFVLMDSVRGWNKARGEYRKTQNYIAPPGAPIERAIYVPPEPMTVPGLLDNFEKYIHQEERDRLVQLSLVHAQFELIHPFLDGNGRVGRLLIPLFLYEKRLIFFPAFYLSAYLEAHRDEYYHRLGAISKENDLLGWVVFFLKAVAVQAREDMDKAKAIQTLYQKMKDQVAEMTRSQFSIQVLDTLFKQPIFSSPQFTKFSKIPKPSVARILSALEKGKVINVIRPGRGKRPTIFTFPKLIKLVA